MEDCDEALGIIVTSYSSELQALTVFWIVPCALCLTSSPLSSRGAVADGIMGNISGQSKNDQIHLFLENINIPHLFRQASWELIRFFGPTILTK